MAEHVWRFVEATTQDQGIKRLPSCPSLRHHSFTLPAISVVPEPLTAPAPPTGCGPWPPKLLPCVIRVGRSAACDAPIQLVGGGKALAHELRVPIAFPPSGLSAPNSLFSPVDRFRLLTGLFCPGAPGYRQYKTPPTKSRDQIPREATCTTAPLATPKTSRIFIEVLRQNNGRFPISETALRRIANLLSWVDQRREWKALNQKHCLAE